MPQTWYKFHQSCNKLRYNFSVALNHCAIKNWVSLSLSLTHYSAVTPLTIVSFTRSLKTWSTTNFFSCSLHDTRRINKLSLNWQVNQNYSAFNVYPPRRTWSSSYLYLPGVLWKTAVKSDTSLASLALFTHD